MSALRDNLKTVYRSPRPKAAPRRRARKADVRGFVEVKPSAREMERRKLEAAACRKALATLRTDMEKAEARAEDAWAVCMCVPGRHAFFMR